jgi:hypothetical protein
MNAELKHKWLEALRSGEFKQGRRQLRSADDSFCCLGVLCHVAKPDGWSMRGHGESFSHSISFAGHCDSAELVPVVGVSQRQCSTLVEMNDRQCNSFAEIADWVEANIPAA